MAVVTVPAQHSYKLQVGNGGDLVYSGRNQAHFGLWALLKAPLLIGTDIRSISSASLKILLKREVIAMNQDDLGVPGDLVYMHGASLASAEVAAQSSFAASPKKTVPTEIDAKP